MTIDTSQNVGIGVTSITSGNRLQVSGGAFSTVGTTGTAVIIDTNATEKFIGDTVGQNGIGIGDSTKYFYVAVANAERMRITAAGLLQFNSGYGSAATAYGCRAWLNFNGTTGATIGGANASATRGGVGTYTVTLATAMVDVNFAVSVTIGGASGNTRGCPYVINSTSSIGILTYGTAGSLVDVPQISVMVFR
jgi:hypothetical protein